MKEDNFTSTVDGAEAYEKFRSDDTHYDYEDEHGDELEEHEDDGDYCGCSDPGCPCGGTKRGSL